LYENRNWGHRNKIKPFLDVRKKNEETLQHNTTGIYPVRKLSSITQQGYLSDLAFEAHVGQSKQKQIITKVFFKSKEKHQFKNELRSAFRL